MDYMRIFMNVFLSGVFYYFFGRINIERFSQAGVSVTKFEETFMKVPSPAIFVANLSDYKDKEPMCNGIGTVEDFANCIKSNTRDNVEIDKPHTRKNRIYRENVLPFFLPTDGSIGFNDTTSLHLTLGLSPNTSFSIWFMDRKFAFSTLNPSISPRTSITIKNSGFLLFLYLKVTAKVRFPQSFNYVFERPSRKII